MTTKPAPTPTPKGFGPWGTTHEKHYQAFVTAFSGLDGHHVVAFMTRVSCGMDWRGCNKAKMAEHYARAMCGERVSLSAGKQKRRMQALDLASARRAVLERSRGAKDWFDHYSAAESAAEPDPAEEVPFPKPGDRVSKGFWSKREHVAKAAAMYPTRTQLQIAYPAAHKAAARYGWLDELLPKVTSQEYRTPRGYWTLERVKQILAENKWESTGAMRRNPLGKAVIMACARLDCGELLPPNMPRERATNPDSSRPRKAPPKMPINCWPFEGPATKADTAVESAT